MTYEVIRPWAAMLGLFIFISLFAGVLIYAFWPGNRERFKRAAHMPLENDTDDNAGGKNGR
jgi:cytochrome c oxidase cbb3-type subunit 4